jgi:hypothetical protein
MRSLLLAALVSSAALAKSEDRDVPAFNAVHVSAGLTATIEIGPRKAIHLEGDERTLALIETQVEGDTLRVGYKPHSWHHDWSDEGRVRITIQTPELRELGASGGSIVKAAFTKADQTLVEASGGSEITARNVDAGTVSAEGSGGSIISLAGSADRLDVSLSGGSQLHGGSFTTRDAKVHGSGGANIHLKATGNVSGSLSGGSELHVVGGASTRVATSGGSQVNAD